MIDDNNFNYKIDKIDDVIDTRGYNDERKTFNFIEKYNKLYTEKPNFYNLKTKTEIEIDIYSALKEIKAFCLNYTNNKLEIYLLKLANGLRIFTSNKKDFEFKNYYRYSNLIFVELNNIWYYQNTSYFTEYNKLLKSFKNLHMKTIM